MKQAFALYPEERHWWSFNDYQAVLDALARLRARGRPVARALEFGPGSSTLALIEGGVREIDTVEDDPAWAATYEDRLVPRFPTAEFPARVRLHRYTWQEPLSIPATDAQQYDVGLIDGPLGSDRRAAAVAYALDRCAAVIVPTEDRNRRVREALHELATARGLRLETWVTGPLSGGFALLTAGPAPVPASPDPVEPVRTPEDALTPMSPAATVVTPVPPALSRRAQKRARKGGPTPRP